MAYKIGGECIGCGSCAAQCPVDAIKEDGGVYVIEEDACIDCGSCAAQCPVDAIKG